MRQRIPIEKEHVVALRFTPPLIASARATQLSSVANEAMGEPRAPPLDAVDGLAADAIVDDDAFEVGRVEQLCL